MIQVTKDVFEMTELVGGELEYKILDSVYESVLTYIMEKLNGGGKRFQAWNSNSIRITADSSPCSGGQEQPQRKSK